MFRKRLVGGLGVSQMTRHEDIVMLHGKGANRSLNRSDARMLQTGQHARVDEPEIYPTLLHDL
jgi:hypothetical protein